MWKVTCLFAAGALASGCAAEQEPDVYVPIATVLQVMEAITIPASDAVWAAAAEPPDTPEGWAAAERSALALAESGNLLLMNGRAPDRDMWYTETVAFIEAARHAVDAARRQDPAGLNEAGDIVYESCLSCHQSYMHPLHDPR